jgi:hypothetical protein
MSDVTLFEERQVRRAFHEEEWWFVLVNIVAALTDSSNPSDYLKKLRRRDLSLADAFEGGDSLSPPCAALRDIRGNSEATVLECGRDSAAYPVCAAGGF